MEGFFNRCESEGGENPLRTRCSLCCGIYNDKQRRPRDCGEIINPRPNPGPSGCFTKECGCKNAEKNFVDVSLQTSPPDWCYNAAEWPSMRDNQWCSASMGNCQDSCGGVWCPNNKVEWKSGAPVDELPVGIIARAGASASPPSK
jgi:hypothetical protein